MVRIGKLPPRRQELQATSTKFDSMPALVGGRLVQARPYEFDGDPSARDTKAIKLATACPECGHGITIDLVLSGGMMTGACDNCGLGAVAAPPPLLDPFCNPLVAGLITKADIMAEYANPGRLAVVPAASVAERMERLRQTPPDDIGQEIDQDDLPDDHQSNPPGDHQASPTST